MSVDLVVLVLAGLAIALAALAIGLACYALAELGR